MLNEERAMEHRRDPLLLGRREDETGDVQREEPGRKYAVGFTSPNRANRYPRLFFGPHWSLDEREAAVLRGVPVRRQLPDGVRVRRVVGQEDPFQAGNQLTEDLHSLRCKGNVQISGPCDVAARTRQALHQSEFHWIAPAHEDDRDPVGRRLGGFSGVPAFSGYDDVNAMPNEIASGLAKLRWIALREAHPDHKVLVFTVSKL